MEITKHFALSKEFSKEFKFTTTNEKLANPIIPKKTQIQKNKTQNFRITQNFAK